ncbi:MAG TPA: di-heme oxidoredictase family protein, partial [Verrucomicrobiae bacterium]|nr:di-heme oxidoredictase family protein [Verrucomicrobiae bacterium]
TSCAQCHSNPATGGDSDITEIRFGTITNNQFDPLNQFGGSLIQSQGIGPISASCNISGETVPSQATIVAKRRTTPLFGLGLVDNVPDRVFFAIADLQKRLTPQIAGRPNLVADVFTNPNRLAVGKFGWKGQVPSLKQFAADAYLNEMGITSAPFPNENCPQGNCTVLTTCDLIHDPEDDGSGVDAFTDFMTLLGPPPRGAITRQVLAGELVFLKVGCAGCHLPVLETGRSSIAALDRVKFFPFSDFLLHDMGSLGDGIAQGRANGPEMRTAPLWGLRVRTTLLHDGRATSVADAILAHDGQGARAKQRFNALTPNEVNDLLAFLNSL